MVTRWRSATGVESISFKLQIIWLPPYLQISTLLSIFGLILRNGWNPIWSYSSPHNKQLSFLLKFVNYKRLFSRFSSVSSILYCLLFPYVKWISVFRKTRPHVSLFIARFYIIFSYVMILILAYIIPSLAEPIGCLDSLFHCILLHLSCYGLCGGTVAAILRDCIHMLWLSPKDWYWILHDLCCRRCR